MLTTHLTVMILLPSKTARLMFMILTGSDGSLIPRVLSLIWFVPVSVGTIGWPDSIPIRVATSRN